MRIKEIQKMEKVKELRFKDLDEVKEVLQQSCKYLGKRSRKIRSSSQKVEFMFSEMKRFLITRPPDIAMEQVADENY